MSWLGRDFVAFIAMVGALCLAVLAATKRPRTFRSTSTVHHLDRVGWQAVPIILLITFLIGGIIAQQGFFHFRKFGADEYVVDMVGILVLREIGVLIVAIMVAGRSGSSYTAELGSMKMREEIDALHTMGFDPVDILILPRIVALIIALPLLTFVGRMAALYGGGLVAWLYGGMSPEIFVARLKEAISLTHFKVGMIKAPFHGAGDRRGRRRRGFESQRQRRVAGPANHNLGREVDLPRHRPRRPVRHFLCLDRDVRPCHPANDIPAVRVRDLVVAFGDHMVLDHLSMEVRRGEILGFVGGSGSGKSVSVAHHHRSSAKTPRRDFEVLGTDLEHADDTQRRAVERRWGVLFQQGALFSSLTALQNVQFPMRENLILSERLLREIGLAKLAMVGLSERDAEQDAFRTVRWHDQTGGARTCARARSRAGLPRRAHLGPRSDLGGRVRRTDPHPAADAWPDGLHGHARSGNLAHGLRSRCGTRRRQGDRHWRHVDNAAFAAPLDASLLSRQAGPRPGACARSTMGA